jgi:hypothetical protein
MNATRTLLLVVLLASGSALAQVEVSVGLPQIRFQAAPALVVVSPGIQVVPDYDDEVFFADGFYWHRKGKHWYRTPSHRGGWVVVDHRIVPASLVGFKPGKFKHYKAPKGPKGHKGKGDKGKGKGK